ncbi:MAG: hypothetical protein JW894_13990 [Bacteroidales bacterium]|nr:hypothetical protein [Bacteroidales bacterium]
MKKINLLLGLSLLAVFAFFTSCSDDENAIGPSLQITSGEAVTASANSIITISWRADAGDAKLATFTITNELGSAVAGWDAYEIPNSEDETYIGSADISIGDEDTYFTLTVEDKDGLEDSKTVNVTIEGNPLNEFTAILLGAQENVAAPSCASLETGETYSISGGVAADNSEEVDIVHYNEARDVALYSPSNSDIQAVTLYGILGWDIKNETLLSTTSISASEFEAIETDLDLDEITTPSDDVVGSLGVDDVIVFETAGGKRGVFIVTDLVDATDGSVTIHVKVEE